jgi:hypothetical protein
MADYIVAADSPRSRIAKERLEIRFKLGIKEQVALVDQVKSLHIRNRMVWPQEMVFSALQNQPYVFVADLKKLADDHPSPVAADPFAAIPEGAVEKDAMSRKPVLIHPHALGQMVKAVQEERKKYNKANKKHGEVDRRAPTIGYIRGLAGSSELWEKELFHTIMCEHFNNGEFLDRKKSPTKFLFRLVGDNDHAKLCGFVSRSFNIFLPSYPLLEAFMHTCVSMGAQPIEASTSEVKFSLKCFLPHVFEPIPGEFVTVGQQWTNSDFGASRLTLSGCMSRAGAKSSFVFEKALSKTHLGPVVEESDLELSDEAMLAMVKAQCLAIRDCVQQQLSPEAVNKILLAVRAAHEEKIPWDRLASQLGSLLRKKEVESVHALLTGGSSQEDLPQPSFMNDDSGNPVPVPTRWWTSNVLAWLSDNETDDERKTVLQRAAGSMLEK